MEYTKLLQRKGILTEEHVGYIQERLAEGKETEETILATMGVTPESLRSILSEYYELPTREISKNIRIKNDVLEYVGEDSARHYRMVPVEVKNSVLVVAVEDPEAPGMRDALNFITSNKGLPYSLEVVLPSDIDNGLLFYENIKGDVGEVLESYESDGITSLDEEISKVGSDELDALSEDAPVTKIVSTILRYAINGGASDIHIEPYEQTLVVRFRIDGDLAKSLELPKRIHPPVIARVKILAQLRLDEKRKPQDGRFSTRIDNRKIDFRVSMLPTSNGEKAVLRILDTFRGTRSFDEIGVTPHVADIIRRAIKKPHGIILMTGPTGSGKTTTLYAMLQEMDREKRNIVSLEDPVEYNIEGVSQSQIRPEIGYTFANGLRSILRQDPDIIMVGEIRDKETAQLAVQAALTGHLVLSTLHTNSALGVVTRLIDMGIDPYLIAPTLRVAIAQRLVQRICPGAGRPVERTGAVAQMIDEQFKDLPDEYRDRIPESDHFLLAEPTDECPTGKKGRVAILEAVEIDQDLQRIILDDADEAKMYEVARRKGFLTLKEDAIVRALNHEISYDEISIMSGEEIATEEIVPEV